MSGEWDNFQFLMSKPSSDPTDYLHFFSYAWEGIRYALRHHRSFAIQVLVGFLVIGLGLILGVTKTEWLILLLVVFAVLVAELLNTAVETALDYVAKEHHVDVKVAKDVAAGGVLVTAIGAVVIGLIIFLPYFL